MGEKPPPGDREAAVGTMKLHDQVDVHQPAEVANGLGVVAIGHDHVLATDVLREFLHRAGLREDLQARELRRGIVPAVLVSRPWAKETFRRICKSKSA